MIETTEETVHTVGHGSQVEGSDVTKWIREKPWRNQPGEPTSARGVSQADDNKTTMILNQLKGRKDEVK